LKWLCKVPELTSHAEFMRQPMCDRKRLAELCAVPRVFNLLIEERIGVNVKSNYIC